MAGSQSQDPIPALAKMALDETTAISSDVEVSTQTVDPFNVEAADEYGIDYDKLIDTFGTRKIDQAILDRFEKLTGVKPHRYLRRGHFFSQRDLGSILDRYEKNKPFFLYTGRGPSSDSMHIGHVIPFTFTK